MVVFAHSHSWLVFRNTTDCGLLKLCSSSSSDEPCTDSEAVFQGRSQRQRRKSETEWERGAEGTLRDRAYEDA